MNPRRIFFCLDPLPREIMRRQKADGKVIGLIGNLRHGRQCVLVAVGQRGNRGLAAGMPLVEALGCKLPFQPPAKNAESPALDERRHGHSKRCILRNFRQELRLGVQIRHQLPAVPHQKEVNVVAVIVDGVEQPQ